MNPRQKSYDSYEKTNKLLKLTNSYYHFRNLECIKNRKSLYTTRPSYINQTPKTKKNNFIQTYYIKKQNESIKNKLKKILLKPIEPKMNNNFIIKENKMKEFRKLRNNIFAKERNKANEYLKKRIKNQKAFINPKIMDRNYNVDHVKALMKLRKFGGNENIVFPYIKSSNDNRSFLDYFKNYGNDSFLKNGRDDESKINKLKSINASSLSNTYYINNKDSGNNSLNK